MDKKRWESVGMLTVTDEVEVEEEVRMQMQMGNRGD